jgi:hypothetical protein
MPTRWIQRPCTQQLDSPYAQEVLADSPVAYWQMQECGGFPFDTSGNGYDLDHFNTTSYPYSARNFRQDGPLNDGRDRSIQWPGGGDIERFGGEVTTVTDGWTIELLIYLEIVGDNGFHPPVQVVVYNGDSGANGWGLCLYPDRTPYILLGGVGLAQVSATPIPYDTWSHVVLKSESLTAKHYLDASQNGTLGLGGGPNAPDGIVTLGADTLQARWAHVAIYDTALSDTRISDHYAAI